MAEHVVIVFFITVDKNDCVKYKMVSHFETV